MDRHILKSVNIKSFCILSMCCCFSFLLSSFHPISPPTSTSFSTSSSPCLQVLLSQTHRLRALQLLKRYLSLGSYAVNLSLVVGIFPYVLKLLQSPAGEVRQLLVSIWASILGFDPSCRQELVRDKMQGYFIQYLLAKEKDMPTAQRCMAAFVLAEICNGYRDGQHSCLQQGLHRTCTGILRSFIEPSTTIPMGHGINSTNGSKTSPGISSGDATQNDYSNSNCKLWISLCLFKLSEDFAYAKYLMFTEVRAVRYTVDYYVDDSDYSVQDRFRNAKLLITLFLVMSFLL